MTEESLRASVASLPLAGKVDFAELDEARRALLQIGLVRRELDRLVPDAALSSICSVEDDSNEELLLALILERERPLWLVTATRGGSELLGELIPEEIGSGLDTIFEDAGRREAFLLARSRVVDPARLSELGALGEDYIVDLCKSELWSAGAEDLCPGVRRVSLISDELGYDVVAPRIDGSTRRLEVKTTSAVGSRVSIFLSRNEISVGVQDKDWFLVVVRAAPRGPELLGWESGAQLAPLMPADRHPDGRWQSARVRIAVRDLTAGLPPLVLSLK